MTKGEGKKLHVYLILSSIYKNIYLHEMSMNMSCMFILHHSEIILPPIIKMIFLFILFQMTRSISSILLNPTNKGLYSHIQTYELVNS